MKLSLKWAKQNWLWLVVNLLAILSLISVFSMFSVDFNGLALPTISLNELTPPPDMPARPEFDARDFSAFDLLVKSTGESAIRWLVLSLSATPLYILFGWRRLLTIKKAAGLYAFLFAVLHSLFFVADKGLLAVFDEFNFILGLLSVLVMLPLALTSTNWSMKQMGRGWKLLHKGAYAAGVLAVLHVAVLGEGSAMLYSAILLIGFAVRVPQLRKAITGFRHNRQRRLASAQGA
ncbi:MAG: hypothetical protein Kow0031_20940 [Anaerolineae bacterium]